MNRKILLSLISLLVAGQFVTGRANPDAQATTGKTAIVAHRGFWKCEQGGNSENSIASLKAAQDAGFWGSECDIQLTKDGRVIVNHNNGINGMKISETDFATLSACLLPNGEKRPSFEEYVSQAAKSKTVLVVELKPQPTAEAEDILLEESVRIMKERDMFSPERVLFISFSRHISKVIAEKYPEFTNQFLTGSDKDRNVPGNIAGDGINGIDYEFMVFVNHPDWVRQAHQLGMSVNAWTVNDEEDILRMIGCEVDAITTNEPLLVRECLGSNELTHE